MDIKKARHRAELFNLLLSVIAELFHLSYLSLWLITRLAFVFQLAGFYTNIHAITLGW
jgi:hypothetical protein